MLTQPNKSIAHTMVASPVKNGITLKKIADLTFHVLFKSEKTIQNTPQTIKIIPIVLFSSALKSSF
jgi:hypothetical protein